MKYLNLLLIVFSIQAFAQQANEYFPTETGYVWFFKTIPLDTLNNEIDSLSFFGADSFATIETYQNKTANLIVSKTGTEASLPFQPYLDSTYINLDGSTGNVFFKIPNLDSLTSGFDSLFGDISSFYDLIKSFEGWYPIYKFQSTVNLEYQIFQFDTTLTIDTLVLPLRFELKGKRLADKTLETQIGVFDCKTFLQTFRVSYLVALPPPLPALTIPLITLRDSIWIAPQKWIVQSIVPSTVFDLTYLQLGSFSIPGSKTIIIPEIISSIQDIENLPNTFYLAQNYPNPFNPITTIKFSIPENSTQSFLVNLKIFDVLGNEIATLVNENRPQGIYEITFNSDIYGLSSGIYFYKLKVGDFVSIKKLVLIK
jgi:hypothetical protein